MLAINLIHATYPARSLTLTATNIYPSSIKPNPTNAEATAVKEEESDGEAEVPTDLKMSAVVKSVTDHKGT